jgi:hypothetical protein
MDMKGRARTGCRVATVGLVAAVVFGIAGVGTASAAPSSVVTCTKNSNSKTKVITAALVAKCIAKGKGTSRSWLPRSSTVDAKSATIAAQAAVLDQAKSDACALEAKTLTDVQLNFESVNDTEYKAIFDAAVARCDSPVPGLPAPSSIVTCTKNSNNKTKVITAALVAKCVYKGKGVAQTWLPQSNVLAQDATIASQVARIDAANQEGCALLDEALFTSDPEINAEFNSDPVFQAIAIAIMGRCPFP